MWNGNVGNLNDCIKISVSKSLTHNSNCNQFRHIKGISLLNANSIHLAAIAEET